MKNGIGGSTAQIELDKIVNRTQDVQPIQLEEYQARIKKAAQLMRNLDVKAVYLNAGTNLYYFTGTKWNASERTMSLS
jgi:Xaa-Pro dipeptidase